MGKHRSIKPSSSTAYCNLTTQNNSAFQGIDCHRMRLAYAEEHFIYNHCVQVNVAKVGPLGGVDLNRAMSTIYNETRAFLIHNYDLTEDMVCALCRSNVFVRL